MLDPMLTNSIMVVPLSQGQANHFKREFAPQFGKFNDWLKDNVGENKSTLTVTAHSAGGAIINSALEKSPNFRKRIKHIHLLDATYSTNAPAMRRYRHYGQNIPDLRISSTYKPGTATARGQKYLERNYPPTKLKAMTSGRSHCDIAKYNAFYDKTSLPRSVRTYVRSGLFRDSGSDQERTSNSEE